MAGDVDAEGTTMRGPHHGGGLWWVRAASSALEHLISVDDLTEASLLHAPLDGSFEGG